MHRAFSGLRDRNTVVGVGDGNVQAFDLVAQTVGDLHACGVVFGAVDFQAGRQTVHRGAQSVGSPVQVFLNAQGGDVGIYR
ncbi:hypothetical protein D3C84_930340 [compost metagenome]